MVRQTEETAEEMETQTDQYQREVYRAMTPQQKYEVMQSLIDSARTMKYAYFRSIHSDWLTNKYNKHCANGFVCRS